MVFYRKIKPFYKKGNTITTQAHLREVKAFSKDIELETRTLLKAELASSYYLLCVVWCGLSPQARAPEYGSLVAQPPA